jgi:hypothetical protein
MSASRPIKYPEPVGCLTEADFGKLKKGDTFYGVLHLDAEIKKFKFGTGSEADKGYVWNDKELFRRAFTNYFHAYAYSLKIKERRMKALTDR